MGRTALSKSSNYIPKISLVCGHFQGQKKFASYWQLQEQRKNLA